jgi:hypothetical protein
VQDLHDILESGSPSSDKPLSFQTWCTLLTENAKQEHQMHRLPKMSGSSNTAGQGPASSSNHRTGSDGTLKLFLQETELSASFFWVQPMTVCSVSAASRSCSTKTVLTSSFLGKPSTRSLLIARIRVDFPEPSYRPRNGRRK